MKYDPAAPRFFAIQVARLGGVAMVITGAAIMAGRIAAPPLSGFALAAAGLIAAAWFPLLLARRWKSPEE